MVFKLPKSGFKPILLNVPYCKDLVTRGGEVVSRLAQTVGRPRSAKRSLKRCASFVLIATMRMIP